MVGGPAKDDTFQDLRNLYTFTEVALDIQAGLHGTGNVWLQRGVTCSGRDAVCAMQPAAPAFNNIHAFKGQGSDS